MNRDEMVIEAVQHGRRNASGWVRVTCPFCPTRRNSPDRKQSFAFNPSTSGFVCNRCRIKGRLFSAYTGTFNGPQREALSIHAEAAGFASLSDLSVIRSQSAKPAYTYLASRGFTMSDIEAADMRVALYGKYSGRIIIPHREADGSWWGFSARIWKRKIDPGCRKVLYPPGMDRQRLYNAPALLEETDRMLLVVEGVLDATWYLPDVVASLGLPIMSHFERLVRFAKRPVCFALDGDAWETGRAWMQLGRFRGRKDFYAVRLPPGEDPNSIDPQWLFDQVEGLTTINAIKRTPKAALLP